MCRPVGVTQTRAQMRYRESPGPTLPGQHWELLLNIMNQQFQKPLLLRVSVSGMTVNDGLSHRKCTPWGVREIYQCPNDHVVLYLRRVRFDHFGVSYTWLEPQKMRIYATVICPQLHRKPTRFWVYSGIVCCTNHVIAFIFLSLWSAILLERK